MPDFAGAALGFMLQIDDQATKTLDASRKSYLALADSMEKVAKVSDRTAGKSSKGMALLAGSFDTVSNYTKDATATLREFVKGMDRASKTKPLKVKTEFAAEALSGAKKGTEVTLKAVYPIGYRDPHFDRTNLLSAYKEMPVPPDYVMKMPFMEEGGIIKKPTIVAAGEAGPEAIIPLEKMGQVAEAVSPTGTAGVSADTSGIDLLAQAHKALEQQLTDMGSVFDDLRSKSEAWGAVGAKKDAVAMVRALDIVQDATVDMEDRWDALYESQRILLGLDTKVRRAARLTGQDYDLLAAQLGVTTNATRLYQGALKEASDENNGFQSTGLSLVKTMDTLKDALFDAVNQSGSLSVALGAAAFAAAYTLDTALFEVRQNMEMTSATFADFEAAGRSTMAEFGTTIEETAAILKQAAFNKLSGDDMRDFVRTVAMGTQALEGMGVTAESMGDLVWDGLNKAGIKGEAANRVVSGLAKAAKIGNVSFDELADTLKKNRELFNLIALRGGNAEKAMLGLASAQATMSNAWMGMDETTAFINDLTDRRKWGDMATQLGAISRATGLSVNELDAMAQAGDTAGLAATRMAVAFEVPDYMLKDPQKLQELYGLTREEVLQATQQFGKGSEGLAKFTKTMNENAAAVAADADRQKSLKESWDAFNNTIGHVWDRLSKKVVPILWELGQPIIWLAKVALKPVIWGLDLLTTVFEYIPGPIKWVMGAFLGLTMAVTAYNASMQLGILTTLGKAAADGAMALATGAATVATGAASAATWLFNAALAANPIGLVVVAIAALVAGIGLLVYGFMEGVTWAKWLGVALLSLVTPFGPIILGATLLYDTLFAGGDMLTGLFTTLADGMNWAADLIVNSIDWVVGMIETVPDRIVSFLEGIPDMLASMFSGSSQSSKVGEAFKKMMWAGARLAYALFLKLPFTLIGLVVKGWYAGNKLIFSAITYPFRAAIDWIGTALSDLWDWIKSIFDSGSIGKGLYENVMGAIRVLLNNYIVDPINGLIESLNALFDWVPGLGPNEINWKMERFAEGGIVTGPTNALMGESGSEAIIPLNDVRAIGEFQKAATGAGVATGTPAPVVNIDQKKTEELLTQIRDLLATVLQGGNPRTGGAKAPSGLAGLASNWEG